MLGTHGLGGQTDLPIPFDFAAIGGAWALTASFAVVAFAWKQPRFSGPGPVGVDVALPARRPWLAVVGLVVAASIGAALFLGDDQRVTGAVEFVYTWWWVGLVPLALVFGPVWRDLSAWRTVAGWISADGLRAYPAGWGYWPAAVGLFSFVWLELASPDPGSVAAVRTWVLGYSAVTVAGGVAFGPRWFDRADPFDVYSAVVAKLRGGLRSLPGIPVDRGLVAVIAVLLGSTAFDSFSASSFWQSRATTSLVDTLTMLAFAGVVGGAFCLAVRPSTPADFAHTLVPIVVGYVIAHYATYLVEKGQRAVIDLLGLTADPNLWLSLHPSVVATIKVVAVVGGHVVAVVAAHDRSLAVLPREKRLTGQIPLMLLMVGYTFAGLYLLLSV